MDRRKLTRADKIRRELKAAQVAQGLTQEQVASALINYAGKHYTVEKE